jgi:hypothetical protein
MSARSKIKCLASLQNRVRLLKYTPTTPHIPVIVFGIPYSSPMAFKENKSKFTGDDDEEATEECKVTLKKRQASGDDDDDDSSSSTDDSSSSEEVSSEEEPAR